MRVDIVVYNMNVDDENDGDYGDYHHLSDCSGPVEGRVSQTSLVEGAISVALLPG